MIKAVIWDIGGVLLTDPKVDEFWKGVEESKEIRHEFGSGKLSTREFVKKASNLKQVSEEEFLDEYKKAYFSVEPIEKSIAIFKSINLPKYILSDTNPLHLEFIKKEFPKLFNLAESCFFSIDLGLRKKNPEIYDLVLNKINLNPKEVLFIDNLQWVIDIVSKKGINCILYKKPGQLKEELSKKGINI